jgi:hypothetical protein
LSNLERVDDPAAGFGGKRRAGAAPLAEKKDPMGCVFQPRLGDRGPHGREMQEV